MIDVTKDMDKKYSYDLLEFKEYNNFFGTPEDEVIGLEFLLAEPVCSDGLVEPFLGVSSASSLTCLGNEVKQDEKNVCNGTRQKTSFHGLRQGEQCQLEDNNGHTHGTDEGILQEMNYLPSICEDSLFKSKGKYSNNGSVEMVNVSTIIYSDLAVEGGRLCQSSARLFNKNVIPEVESCGKEVPNCDSIATFSSLVSDGSMSFTDNDACFTKQRSRKRPQRYMDEYSKYHFVRTDKRSGGPSKYSREKIAHTSYLDCTKDVKERTTMHYNEYIIEPIQVPFGPSTWRDCSKKKTSLSRECDLVVNKAVVKFSKESTDTELSLNPSQDDRSDDYELGKVTKDKSGRKHNRYWSENEIAKLIEGVGKFGVGRWKEIRRGLFPPATRRTTVDLKDKWRNLLKACNGHLHCKNKGRRTTHQQVSQSVLRQVKELATMYPYPKIPSRKNDFAIRC